MLFKNSIKVLISNFNLVWKMILYFLLGVLACSGLLALFLNPVIRLIEDAGFFEKLIDLYSSFITSLNLSVALQNLSIILDDAWEFFVSNISQVWWNIVCSGVVVFFLSVFYQSLSHLAVCNSLHLYIGSLTKQGFFASFADVFVKNLRLQISRYLVGLPLSLIYMGLFLASLKMFRHTVYLDLLAVFVIVVGFVVLMAFKMVLFSAWAPTMTVMNYGVFKSLRVALKMNFRRFGRVFSSSIAIVLGIVVLNMFLGLFTFFVGLILSIPVSFIMYNAFGMVCVYEGQGMRYYVDIYNVITPNKKEISDKLNDMKYII
ncbi:MAG: hypothetical protein E7356_00815 [Clostridiales bacterium]|nr:hypothetical protein [Clostridiales bacterium]